MNILKLMLMNRIINNRIFYICAKYTSTKKTLVFPSLYLKVLNEPLKGAILVIYHY